MNKRSSQWTNNRLYKSALRLTHADITFFILPLLMLNLIAGTLAQRWLGLFDAQKMFFSTFITWAGPVPLPGGYILIGVFTLSLFLKFILRSSWHKNKAGIILAHLGALVLLVGGLFTALTAREGYMVIPEGGQTPYVYDYHKRDVFIFENDHLKKTIAFDSLRAGQMADLDVPFMVRIVETCQNCAIEKRDDHALQSGDLTLQSMARFMALIPAPLARENEENMSGLSLEITGAGEHHDGLYIAFEGMPEPIKITAKNGRNYKIIFGKEQRLLPFSVELVSFRQENHPGSAMAKSFTSDVIVHDGDVRWPARIAMNEPLRYKGYSLFQSAFDRAEDGSQATVLSVVENRGQLFPYLGTLIIAAGLLLHIFITVKGRHTP